MYASMKYQSYSEPKTNQYDADEIIDYKLDGLRNYRVIGSTLGLNGIATSDPLKLSVGLNLNQMVRPLEFVRKTSSCLDISKKLEEPEICEKSSCESKLNRQISIKNSINFKKRITKSNFVRVQVHNRRSCGILYSTSSKTMKNTYLKSCYTYSMSKLEKNTTCFSFQQSTARKEHNKETVVTKGKGCNSNEKYVGNTAINIEIGSVCCKDNSITVLNETSTLNKSNISDPNVVTLCDQVDTPPLSDNTKISNWVRMVESGDRKNNSSTIKRKLDQENRATIQRRTNILVNQAPLRQICKTNRRRRELFDMSVLKVLHSSLRRIFVTLSALAFVTFVAGSPSYGSSGK